MNKSLSTLEIEEVVLGAILIQSGAIFDVSDILKPQSFSSASLGTIYEVCLELTEQGKGVDPRIVVQALREKKLLDQVGGASAIAALTEAVASKDHIRNHALKVVEYASRRKLITIGKEVEKLAKDLSEDTFEIIDKVKESIDDSLSINVGGVAFDESLSQTFYELTDGKKPFFTGYRGVDDKTGGFKEGELVVVAGRTGMGKTNVLLAFAKKMAEQGIGVGIYSLEMPAGQVCSRLLSAHFKRPLKMVRLGDADTLDHMYRNVGDIKKLPIIIDDTSSLNIQDLKVRIRRMVKQHGVKIVFVDYIQLLLPTKEERTVIREQVVANISRNLKILAQDLGIVIFAGAQLNRMVDSRGGRPQLSDIRESGAVEQDANKVLLLLRKSYYDKTSEDGIGNIMDGPLEEGDELELIVAKNREGETGSCKLVFQGEYASIEEKKLEFP